MMNENDYSNLLFSGAMDKMTNINRKSDFISVLKTIQDGLLWIIRQKTHHIISATGHYASGCMRCNRETMDFRVTF